ncbi:MAG TPA: OmpA family protein [Bryobacteraceae bacterium]|nr:OmpA family protein [Bryobacteraceae bacterium]
MRYQRYVSILFLFTLLTTCAFAQGLNTTASKDDWEEINFEFNSPVLTDGYPSLLRLAELLQKHPDYKVRLEGHADVIGSNRYNERLGQRRADAVKAFLVKYGAGNGQVTSATFGETQPKIPSRDKEARFMNRRVFMTVTDGQGRTVLDRGGINEAIKTMDDLFALQKKCCDDILRRLDKLDDIANMLTKMVAENDSLRKELGGLRQAHDELDKYVKALPKPLTEQQTASIVDTRTAEQIERARMPRFSLINVNAGADQSGNLTATGRGRLFLPFKEQLAIQLQGEYMYFRDRQEGQADIGLVNRFMPRAQAGLFASFKHVNFSGRDPGRNIFTDRPVTQFDTGQMTGNGLLGQASLTLDYLFTRGKVGVFGSKGFLQDAVLGRFATQNRNVFTEYFLRTVDQVGLSTTVGLMGDVYLEGNLGYLKSRANADRVGGTARFVFPFSERLAFTLEGGMNETLVSVSNTGRVVAGLQFGNFMRPKDYLEGYNGVQHAVPVDVPRVRYEVMTRTVRTGNDAPVADAGPDQLGIGAGSITLDASGSQDPEGEALTYQWTQVAGPAVSLSGMNTARATFTAAEGQSYGFRVVVKDPQGLQGSDSITITTSTTQPVQIARFQASPDRIRAGQQATIDWQVLNADSVTISPEIGTVSSNGTRTVSPRTTTQYRLTARNRTGEVTATTTVVVEEEPAASFTTCSVSPMNIMAGESATITYATSNAETVSISGGIGNVATSGTQVVSPTQTTTYTLTANNARGPVTCNLTVQVTQGTAPRVLRFTADPASITSGNASTLNWAVENAQTVTISTLGTVQNSGTREVRPTQTTTYTLTATNANGSVTSTTTVTVTAGPGPNPGGGAPTLTGCSASPTTSPAPGQPVVISFLSTNATSVAFSPTVTGVGLAGPITVRPTASTTYTITATGANNQTATCTVAITVTPTPAPPAAVITGPEVIETFSREVVLNADVSANPTGGALTYVWTPLGTGAAVLDQGQPRTRVQLGGLAGDYQFRLTVRNPTGQESSAIVTVRFRSSTIP